MVFTLISEPNNEDLLSTSLPNQRFYRQRTSNIPTNNNGKDIRLPSATKSGRLLAAKWMEHQQRRNSSVDNHPHQGSLVFLLF